MIVEMTGTWSCDSAGDTDSRGDKDTGGSGGDVGDTDFAVQVTRTQSSGGDRDTEVRPWR